MTVNWGDEKLGDEQSSQDTYGSGHGQFELCLRGDSTIQRMHGLHCYCFLIFPVSLYIDSMCLFGFHGLLSLGMGWKAASRTGVE